MTLALAGAILGVLYGILRARKAGGNRLDQAQYAAVYAMLFALIGLVIAIVLVRAA